MAICMSETFLCFVVPTMEDTDESEEPYNAMEDPEDEEEPFSGPEHQLGREYGTIAQEEQGEEKLILDSQTVPKKTLAFKCLRGAMVTKKNQIQTTFKYLSKKKSLPRFLFW